MQYNYDFVQGLKEEEYSLFAPRHMHSSDTAYDLSAYLRYSTDHFDKAFNQDAPQVVINPGENILISSGLIFEMPKPFWTPVLLVEHEGTFKPEYIKTIPALSGRTRSGLGLKLVVVANSPSTIDNEYPGVVYINLFNASKEEKVIQHGDRIAQVVQEFSYHLPFEHKPDLKNTRRSLERKGGHGSTGS